MRRLAVVLVLLSLTVAVPAPVAEAAKTCTIDVSPLRGSTHSPYRISGHHFPLSTNSPLEVDMAVSRISYNLADLGHVYVTIYFVFLVPGLTDFYVDFNAASGGEPAPPILSGRYLVQAFTPHVAGCRTSSGFVVRARER